MDNRIILLTGVTGAIGQATVTAPASKENVTLVLAVRNTKALARIVSQLPNRKASIDIVPLDLSSFTSVEACIRKITAAYTKLHAIVNIAAVTILFLLICSPPVYCLFMRMLLLKSLRLAQHRFQPSIPII